MKIEIRKQFVKTAMEEDKNGYAPAGYWALQADGKGTPVATVDGVEAIRDGAWAQEVLISSYVSDRTGEQCGWFTIPQNLLVCSAWDVRVGGALMRQYLGLTVAKALRMAQPTEMCGGETVKTLVWRGVLYIVSAHTVETYRGHADVITLDCPDHRVVLYA